MAVGWSSDVLPIAKRTSNVAVVVPKSGASLWADLWVCPTHHSRQMTVHFSALNLYMRIVKLGSVLNRQNYIKFCHFCIIFHFDGIFTRSNAQKFEQPVG